MSPNDAQALNPLAVALNEDLERAAPEVFSMLSAFGWMERRMK